MYVYLATVQLFKKTRRSFKEDDTNWSPPIMTVVEINYCFCIQNKKVVTLQNENIHQIYFSNLAKSGPIHINKYPYKVNFLISLCLKKLKIKPILNLECLLSVNSETLISMESFSL